MKKPLIIITTAILSIAVGCKKDEVKQTPNSSVDGITRTRTFDFHPYEVGKTFVLHDILREDTVTTNIIDKVILNNTEWLLSVDNKSDTIYYRCDSEFSYSMQIDRITRNQIAIRDVKINGRVGDVWVDNFVAEGFPFTLTNTIEAINKQRTVKEVTYDKVTTVKQDVSITTSQGDYEFTIYNYYDRKTGAIEIDDDDENHIQLLTHNFY